MLKQHYVEIGILCYSAHPTVSECSQFKSQVCDSLSDVMWVLTTDKTHNEIKMRCV